MPIIELEQPIEEMKSDFPVIPGGTYLGELVKVELVNAKSSGKPMLKTQWKIIDGEYAGRIVFDNVPLHVSFRVKQYAEAAGIQSGTQINTDDLQGAQAILDVTQEENPEKPGDYMNKIKKITKS
jgi:hypothetical protein